MRTSDKIILGILVILLVGMSSVFIAAFDSGTSTSKEKPYSQNTLRVIEKAELEDDEDEEADEEITPEQLKGIVGIISETEAIEIALGEVDGRVLGVETEREGGRILYNVEIMSDREMAEVEVDAKTGRVLEVEFGDDD